MVSISHLLIFGISCIAVALTAIVQNRPNYDVYGNLKSNEFHNYNPDCCIVPSCDDSRMCFNTVRCDHICSSGNYQKASYGRTPGYRLKETYTKYDCHFNQCGYFNFTCKHCPDPGEADFSIYTVRKDCSDCYQKQI